MNMKMEFHPGDLNPDQETMNLVNLTQEEDPHDPGNFEEAACISTTPNEDLPNNPPSYLRSRGSSIDLKLQAFYILSIPPVMFRLLKTGGCLCLFFV